MRYRALAVLTVLAVLVALPPLLGTGLQNAMVNMLIAALFAAAFNLLMGQGGMLSFGHAAYYGVGAFATLHLMQHIEYTGFAFPTVLLPLAGAVAGLVAGIGAGYFATRRSGVYFALVTLALAELLHSLAPHWEGVFGGEAGLSSMRMPSMGLVFGSTLEVYYLTLVWVVLCLGLLYAYTCTPFGRLTLALRDNEQRVRFLGYNAHASKMLVFALSAMFSGVAGSLYAVSAEIANYSIFSMHVSAQVVLHTFIGGSTVFFGPVIGASLLTLFTFLVSEATRSWLLYQGVIFVLVMLYAPHGLGGIVQAHVERWHSLPWRRLWGPYLSATGSALLIAAAGVFAIQILEEVFSERYRAAVARTGAYEPVHLVGVDWDPLSPVTWIIPVILLVVGLAATVRISRHIRAVWNDASTEDDIPHTAAATARANSTEAAR